MTEPTDDSLLDQCDTCKFWKNFRFEYGNCRRYPPTQDLVQMTFVKEMGYTDDSYASDSVVWWAQPATSADDWCGEFKPAKS